jgi:hypothetical protein
MSSFGLLQDGIAFLQHFLINKNKRDEKAINQKTGTGQKNSIYFKGERNKQD